jgi:hypothetical protein
MHIEWKNKWGFIFYFFNFLFNTAKGKGKKQLSG